MNSKKLIATLITLAIIIVGLYVLYSFLPILIAMTSNVLYLGGLIVGIALIIIFVPKFIRKLWKE